MPHLVDLQGRPLSWDTLHARNEAYWQAREPDPPAPPPRFELVVSQLCFTHTHSRCRGLRGRGGAYRCECGCHGFAA